MKRLAFYVTFLVTFLLLWTPCFAGQNIGLSGAWHNGHSYSGQDKIDPAGSNNWAGSLSYERGTDNGRGIDVTYGIRTDFLRFTKRDNIKRSSEHIYAAVPAVEARTYYRDILGVDFFVGLAIGAEFATDGYSPAISGVAGFERQLSESISVAAYGRDIVTTERRHDLFGIELKYRF